MENLKKQQNVKLVDITPSSENMEKLYDLVIPNLGYTFMTALHDIGDNSIDASCSNLTFVLVIEREKLVKILIADDGSGMSTETLYESFKPASITPHDIGDLGKFGVGGTFGSHAIAKSKTVLTKVLDEELLCCESGTNSPSANQVIERIPSDYELSMFDKYCGESGTLIILEDIRDLESGLEDPDALYNKIVKETAAVYRKFIDAGIKISVVCNNGPKSKQTIVKSFDPLYHDQKDKLEYSHSEVLEWQGSEIKLRYSMLNPDMFEDKADKSYDKQGAYIMRNNRQIMVANNVKGLWQNNPLYNMGRVEISYTSELDDQFKTDAKKSKVIPIHKLIQFLIKESNIKGFKQFVAGRYDKNSAVLEKQQKEDQTFAKNLQKHGGVLGIPKQEKNNNNTNVTPIKSYKTGKSRSVSKSTRQPSRKAIKFVYQNIKKGPHVWYEMDSPTDLTIVINENHKFIQDNYISGTKSTKRLLSKVFAAQLLALSDLWDTNNYDVVDAYNDAVDKKLKTIHSLI